MRYLKLLTAVLALTLFAACAPLKKQAFNREAAGNIHVVVVTQPENQTQYEAAIIGHPAAGFGLIGGLIAAADINAKSNRLTTAIDVQETRLQERFSAKLADDLKEIGYDAKIVAIPKGTNEADMLTVARRAGDSDAVVELTIYGGYWAAGPTTDYVPRMLVKVKSVDTHSGATLYEDSFSYGYTPPTNTQIVHLDADQQYRFTNIDALVADPTRTRAGLYAGVDLIAGQIAADLKKN